MTNVPGPGFIVVLATLVSVGLVMVVGAIALVTNALTDRPFWQSMGGAYLGVGLVSALVLVSQWGLESTGRSIFVMGAVGYLLAGLLFYAVLVSPGVVLVRVLFDGVGWDEAATYATIGWIAGHLTGLALILSLDARTLVDLRIGLGLGILGSIAGGPLATKLLYTPDTGESGNRTP